jgi:hypothetical protein
MDEPASGRRASPDRRTEPGFASDAAHFSRVTALSYAYADIALAGVWNAGLLVLAPTFAVFIPAAVTGTAAVLVDYVWFYRAGRREVLVDGVVAGPRFVAWWLVGWFDFLIAWNIGSLVGVVLLTGLSGPAGQLAAGAFVLWFWILTPALSRAIGDLGIGAAVVTTTRRVGSSLSLVRILWVAALYLGLFLTVLDRDAGRTAELFAIGLIAAGAMEVPLYVLGIRPGRRAWQALVLNTLVEWNYAVPVFFLAFHLAGLGP